MSTEPDLLSLPWRTGRHNGRAIYAQALCMDDAMVGVMDSPEPAREGVRGPQRGDGRASGGGFGERVNPGRR